MPLTLKEYHQIATAIDAMHGYNIEGRTVVHQENVKALIQRWIGDEKPKPAARRSWWHSRKRKSNGS